MPRKPKGQSQSQSPPKEAVPSNPFQAFLSTFWNTRWRVPGILLLTGGSFFLFLPKDAMERLQGIADSMINVSRTGDAVEVVQAPFPEEPKVVAIAPDSEFGTLHFTGLELGLLYEDELSLVRLTAPLADMKHGRVKPLTQQLAQALARRDVVAVVGPGITECTNDILQTVEQSGYPVVVFANSAAPRYLLRTEKGTTPVFRINSGIDERAERLAQLSKRLLEKDIPVLYLVEQNPDSGRKSFGQELDSQIRRNLDLRPYLASGLFRKHVFPSENVEGGFDVLAAEFQREQVIFLLGLGHDYKALVEEFYAIPGKGETTAANLVGVMTSYAIDELYEAGSYAFSHLFEITDVELKTNPEGLDTPEHFGTFLRQFKLPRMNPAHRDEAFAFDAGLSLSTAWNAVKEARSKNAQLSYQSGLASFATAVQGLKLQGVSGAVAFKKEALGEGFQNLGTVGTQLTLCRYRPELRNWEEVPPDSLGRFERTTGRP